MRKTKKVIEFEELTKLPNQGFSETERDALTALKGVGPSVVRRLEELGFSKLSQLCDSDPKELAHKISTNMGSTCWRNSPQARKALHSVIALANSR